MKSALLAGTLSMLLACGGGGSAGGSGAGAGGSGAPGGDPATDASVLGTSAEAGPGSGPGTDGGVGCIDKDGDGRGAGCAKGADCDDSSALCGDDCSDADANGVADCRDLRGNGVLLYTGANATAWDQVPSTVRDLYVDSGVPAIVAATLPSTFLADYGVLLLENPTTTIGDDVVTSAKQLLGRGGRVVSVVDHSSYGGHAVAAALLTAVGSTMHSNPTSMPGSLQLIVTPTPPLTDGVTSIRPYYAASVTLGSGHALGATADGYVVIGYERVLRGDVVVIGDSSMFGFALGTDDNKKFIVNLAHFTR